MSQLRIRRKTPMVLSREQEVLIERMMDEWEEEQSDATLRAEIEADKELGEMLSTMRSHTHDNDSILHQPDNSESTIFLSFHRNLFLAWIAHPSHVSHRLHRMLAFGSMASSGRTSELVSDGSIMNHGAVLSISLRKGSGIQPLPMR